jgi:hypothetical protein
LSPIISSSSESYLPQHVDAYVLDVAPGRAVTWDAPVEGEVIGVASASVNRYRRRASSRVPRIVSQYQMAAEAVLI